MVGQTLRCLQLTVASHEPAGLFRQVDGVGFGDARGLRVMCLCGPGWLGGGSQDASLGKGEDHVEIPNG